MSGRPSDYLVVAADSYPIIRTDRHRYTYKNLVTELVEKLKRTNVTIKVGPVLRAIGYDLINLIHFQNMRVFADLKLVDIKNTLELDGVLLNEARPEMITVYSDTTVEAMKILKLWLPDTKVLGVTVMTDSEVLSEDHLISRVRKVRLAGISELVASAYEIPLITRHFSNYFSVSTPGVRLQGVVVPGDDQNPKRVMTPFEAIQAGANRIIVGRPVTMSNNPYDTVMRILEEIQVGLKEFGRD